MELPEISIKESENNARSKLYNLLPERATKNSAFNPLLFFSSLSESTQLPATWSLQKHGESDPSCNNYFLIILNIHTYFSITPGPLIYEESKKIRGRERERATGKTSFTGLPVT